MERKPGTTSRVMVSDQRLGDDSLLSLLSAFGPITHGLLILLYAPRSVQFVVYDHLPVLVHPAAPFDLALAVENTARIILNPLMDVSHASPLYFSLFDEFPIFLFHFL